VFSAPSVGLAVAALLLVALAGCGDDKADSSGDKSGDKPAGKAAAAPPKAKPAPAATPEQAAKYNKERVVQARFVEALPNAADKLADALAEAPGTEMILYRQRTVRLLDRHVNAALKKVGPRKVMVKAVYDKATLVLSASWPDATMNQLQHGDSTHFGDAAALEIPQEFGFGRSLPYVGMGDETHPVVVTVVRARKEKPYARQFVAAGFGSLTRIDRNTDMAIVYDAGKGRWTATWKRPLRGHNVDLAQGLVPIALAVWDGGIRERGGNKAVTSWHLVRLGKHPLDDKYLRYVAWGESGEPVGDAARGKTQIAVCTACHRLGDKPTAPKGMAPGLDNIGGYALAQYIRESIVSPSAVVIRQLNINRHYDPKGKKSARGAYPKNTAFTWYSGGAKPGDKGGKATPRTSKMPPFAHLADEDLNDIVAYLKSLKTPMRDVPAAVAPAAAPGGKVK